MLSILCAWCYPIDTIHCCNRIGWLVGYWEGLTYLILLFKLWTTFDPLEWLKLKRIDWILVALLGKTATNSLKFNGWTLSWIDLPPIDSSNLSLAPWKLHHSTLTTPTPFRIVSPSRLNSARLINVKISFDFIKQKALPFSIRIPKFVSFQVFNYNNWNSDKHRLLNSGMGAKCITLSHSLRFREVACSLWLEDSLELPLGELFKTIRFKRKWLGFGWCQTFRLLPVRYLNAMCDSCAFPRRLDSELQSLGSESL